VGNSPYISGKSIQNYPNYKIIHLFIFNMEEEDYPKKAQLYALAAAA